MMNYCETDFRFQFYECIRVSLYVMLGLNCSLWMIAKLMDIELKSFSEQLNNCENGKVFPSLDC